MWITSLSGVGVLSFDQFRLDLDKRLTFIVGPNGAGKSNLTRLLTICLRAIDSADGAAAEADRLLASFLAARHVGSKSPSVEARVAVRLNDASEQQLVTEFVRAMVTGALTSNRTVENLAEIDTWAEAEITESKLQPLMEGEIVVSHPGTQDGRWECTYEFSAPGYEETVQPYRWILLGWQSGTIFDARVPPVNSGSDIAARVTGSSQPPPGASIPVPGKFDLLDLIPKPDLSTRNCTFDLTATPSASQRRFAQMTGLSLINPGGGRMVSLATVLRVIFRRALVQTSDTRLLPSGGISWSSSELALKGGAEIRLPKLLLELKNGDPTDRAHYRQIRELFQEFTQGRRCEVRLIQIPQPTDDGHSNTTTQAPSIWVSVNASVDPAAIEHEVPIEFAGAGAWEALVLASVLGESLASIVVLDEPAVALHPSLQRELGTHLHNAKAQFLVITHSAELLPLAEAANTRLVRIDRDNYATRAWRVDEACRGKMVRKLAAKGNERLPFAWRAILCEGQDDVGAIVTLAGRMGIDLRRLNIAVTDCGGRENLPDYIWFCAELGLTYLAIMDADSATPDAHSKAQAVRDAVKRHQGGELAEFPINLETTFGVAKPPRGQPSPVPDAIRQLPFVGDMPDSAQVGPEVTKLAKAIQRLAT